MQPLFVKLNGQLYVRADVQERLGDRAEWIQKRPGDRKEMRKPRAPAKVRVEPKIRQDRLEGALAPYITKINEAKRTLKALEEEYKALYGRYEGKYDTLEQLLGRPDKGGAETAKLQSEIIDIENELKRLGKLADMEEKKIPFLEAKIKDIQQYQPMTESLDKVQDILKSLNERLEEAKSAKANAVKGPGGLSDLVTRVSAITGLGVQEVKQIISAQDIDWDKLVPAQDIPEEEKRNATTEIARLKSALKTKVDEFYKAQAAITSLEQQIAAQPTIEQLQEKLQGGGLRTYEDLFEGKSLAVDPSAKVLEPDPMKIRKQKEYELAQAKAKQHLKLLHAAKERFQAELAAETDPAKHAAIAFKLDAINKELAFLAEQK